MIKSAKGIVNGTNKQIADVLAVVEDMVEWADFPAGYRVIVTGDPTFMNAIKTR